MRTPEKVEKDKIDAYLAKIGAFVVKPATYGYGASGAPDRICCVAGRFFGIEVKREGKQPTALQALRMRQIEAAGGRTAWGTAAKVIPEIEVWLKTLAFGGPV